LALAACATSARAAAFIETTLHLPMHARVMLRVKGNDSATQEVDIAASVARVDRDGIGVEWYETPAGPYLPGGRLQGLMCRLEGDDRLRRIAPQTESSH
jgi:hypothetical protein